jgi:nucleotide-binding universal stress UspA family protein
MSQHKVLIPVDGSRLAREIFDYVLKFLPPQENALILLRVGDPPEGHVGFPMRVATPDSPVAMFNSAHDVNTAVHPIYASQERHSAEGEFQRQMQADVRLLERAGYAVTSCTRFGDPGEEIVAFAKNHQVDLVAMSTHGRRGLNRLIFGSVAQYVAQRLSVPVMMLRAGEAA